MSNNLNKLYALPELLHARGCPVIIVAGVLYKLEGTDEKILVQLKFKNMGDKIVKAIKVDIQTFDVSGNPVDEKLEHQYLDLSIGFNSEYTDRKGVLLKTKTIRSFNVKITEIVFSNGDIWSNNIEFQPLPKPADIKEKLGAELAEQYKREIGKYAKYEPFPHEDIWCCTCGEYNRIDESFCHYCKTNRIKQFESLDHSHLSKNKEIFEKEKQIKAEKQAQEERIQKEKNKKVAKISGITLSIFAIVLVLVVALVINIQKNNNYNKALSMMNDGNYSEAVLLFEKLETFKESEENISECNYHIALDFVEAGKCDEAIEIFESLGEYKDSNDQIVIANKEKKYRYAISLLESQGDHTESYNIFSELDDYKDSKDYLTGFVRRIVKGGKTERPEYDIYYKYDNEGYLIKKGPITYSYSEDKLSRKHKFGSSTYTETFDKYGNIVRNLETSNGKEVSRKEYSYECGTNGEIIKQTINSFRSAKQTQTIVNSYTRDKNNHVIKEEQTITYISDGEIWKYTTNVSFEESEDGYMVIHTDNDKFGDKDMHIIGWVYAPEANEKSELSEPIFLFNTSIIYYSR